MFVALLLDSVKAFDSKNLAKGPVFTFEVTIVRPLITDNSGLMSFENVVFDLNALIKRHFILVPTRVTWASKCPLKLSLVNYTYKIFMLHVCILHSSPHKTSRLRRCCQFLSSHRSTTTTKIMQMHGVL